MAGFLEDDIDTNMVHKQKELECYLNDLDTANYDMLLAKILDIGIDSESILDRLVDQVFERALGESASGEICAQLCYDLDQALTKPGAPPIVAHEEGQEVRFRRVLLYKCQKEFEKGELARKAVTAQNQQERKRALGNIQFMGFLYRQKMLTAKIIIHCMMVLLDEADRPPADDIECLCKLLTVVGATVENRPKPEVKDQLDASFGRIKRLSQAPDLLDVQSRSQLQDVLEQRGHGWEPRRSTRL